MAKNNPFFSQKDFDKLMKDMGTPPPPPKLEEIPPDLIPLGEFWAAYQVFRAAAEENPQLVQEARTMLSYCLLRAHKLLAKAKEHPKPLMGDA